MREAENSGIQALDGGVAGEGGEALAGALYLDTGGNTLAEGRHMGNNADGLTGFVQFLQAGDDLFQGIGIERAEAFIEEEGVDAGGLREVRKTERQGEADEEGLATGKVGG